MIIDLSSIPQGSRSYRFTLEADRWRTDDPADPILGLNGPVSVHVELDRLGNKFILNGSINGTMFLRCDRCLETYSHEFNNSFKTFLTLPTVESAPSEVELQEEDLEKDFLDGETLDLALMSREQIYLALPMKNLCSSACPGLCPKCGQNLNSGPCQCSRPTGHPAFEKLKNLSTKGEL